MTIITEPGVHLDMDEAEYHAHPALSYSTGKHLLRSPQHYLHALENREESTTFDEGHVIHTLVLGSGAEIVEIPYDSYRSNAAKEMRDEAYADGKTPIKAHLMEPLQRAAEAVREHPTALAWLEAKGDVEVPLFATDPETGIEIRGKLDKLARLRRRAIPVDLKTMADARAFKVFQAIRDQDYDLQSAMYQLLIKLALGETPGPGVLIAVEKEPPFGVAVYQLSHEDLIASGELKLRTMLRRAKALRDNPSAWPGYPLGTQVLTPSAYYLQDLEERLSA